MNRPSMDNVVDAYPLTPLQQGMLYHVVTDADPGTYVNQSTFAVNGELDVGGFQAAWDDVIRRHDALRTSFVWDGVDRPLQIVHDRVALGWDIIDLRHLEGDERESRLQRMMQDDFDLGIDIAAAPLMRMQLARIDEDEWRWTWTCHHLIADAWSVQVILSELRELYARRTGATPAKDLVDPPRFRDFVAARLDDDDGTERHWRSRLAGFTEPHRLRVPGMPTELDDDAFSSVTITIDRSTTADISTLARTHRVTMSSIASAAWAVVVSRWARTDDVVFGITSSGRDPSIREVAHGVGLYINTVPCRVQVDASRTVSQWLPLVHRSVMDTVRHDQTPLASIQRWSDVAPGEPLFESIVVVENVPEEPDVDGSISIRAIEFTEHSNYPVAVLVTPGEELGLRIVHDKSLLSAPAALSVIRQLAFVLTAMVREPAIVISRIGMTVTEDVERLGALEAGPDLLDDLRTAHGVLEDQAREIPSALAIIAHDTRITYRELDERANGVAHALVAEGVAVGDLVGVHVARSIDTIVAMMGVLKTGAAYVPLDPTYPTDHLIALIEDARIGMVISTPVDAEGLPSGVRVFDIASISVAADTAPDIEVRREDPAYVIHTSGSTGRPKGVVITHANLVRSTTARPVHYGEPVGRYLLLSSFSFDSSVAGIYWSLFTGGTLVLPPVGAEHDVNAVLSLIRDQSITHLLCLPSLYRLILAEASSTDLESLRVAIVAGEASSPDLLLEHLERGGPAELHNEYGPTEATVWCSVHRATPNDAGGPLPMGRPVAGTSLHLLDRYGNRVPQGFAGEVFVSGPSVSPGYLHRPDLTAERFVDVPGIGKCYRTGDLAAFRTDGTLVFLGRADHQLKIRGHRIEPSAVESVITEDVAVEQCVVIGVPATRDGHRLVAYVTSGDPDFDPDDVRSRLRRSVPPFMVPDLIVPLDALPRLPNGKVDRSALLDPIEEKRTTDAPVAPRTDTEATLVSIWSDLLGRDDIGTTDDFFALGGDSIVSIQMISRARQAGIPMEPGLVSTHPTIAELADAVGKSAAPAVHGAVVGEVPLGPAQHWFLREEFDDTDQWNLTIALAVPPDIREPHLEKALGALIEHHDMLRARIRNVDGAWGQTVDDRAEFPFESVTVPADRVNAIIAETQAALDLRRGPLARAVLIRTVDRSDAMLVLVAHHLVVDVVSWVILIDDLESAYRQALSGTPIELAPRTTSYRDWITHLMDEDRTEERAFWLDLARRAPAPPIPARRGREADIAKHEVSLDQATTTAFLGAANDAYSTRPDELLVAAVGTAVTELERSGRTWISVEGHGRPAGVAEMDLTRTVGWFTSRYPIPIERQGSADLIKTVKETMRSIPKGGVGLGVLRDIVGDEEIRSMPAPQVNLNYVGRGVATADGNIFRWTGTEPPESRHRDARLPFAIEIIASIRSGELVLECRFDSLSFEAERMHGFARTAKTALVDLIDHCTAEGSGGYTPSDFPEAGLDQSELDDLLAEL
jgi:amino acid adenylation domain-containing protein/non-ribosomal peptide synthase protein (TIGR01720 family)